MFPALKSNIVVVKGYSASGAYDLNIGAFHRISHEAGEFLTQELTGVTSFDKFEPELKDFIIAAINSGLVEMKDIPQHIDPTNLNDVLKSSRPVRFAWIEITSVCNQKCLHCFLGEDLNRYKHIPFKRIKENIDTLVKEGIRQLVISGGEPTLHPQIIEILDYAGRANVNLSLLSNGSSIHNNSVIEAILRNDVVVKMPILGWRNSHEQMAGLKGSFKKLLKSIFTYAKSGVNLQLGTTVTSVNAADVAKIAKFADFMGLSLEVSPIYQIGFARNNKDILFQHSMRELIELCKVTAKHKKPRYGAKIKTRITLDKQATDYESVDLKNYLTDTHECGQKIIAVLSSGEVTPCLMIRSPDLSMGNTNQRPLAEILKGPTREEFNNKMKLNNIVDCRGCEARYVCKAGGCPATTLAFKNTIVGKNPMYSNCYYVNQDTVKDTDQLQGEIA